MTTYKERTLEQVSKKIEELSGEYLIETNSGTFSGDPQFDEWRLYEALDGSRRLHGPDPKDAPGYRRKLNVPSAKARRAQVKELQEFADKLLNCKFGQPLPHFPAGINY